MLWSRQALRDEVNALVNMTHRVVVPSAVMADLGEDEFPPDEGGGPLFVVSVSACGRDSDGPSLEMNVPRFFSTREGDYSGTGRAKCSLFAVLEKHLSEVSLGNGDESAPLLANWLRSYAHQLECAVGMASQDDVLTSGERERLLLAATRDAQDIAQTYGRRVIELNAEIAELRFRLNKYADRL